ncbi:MAG: asparagine synthase-related protein, partial [Clostridia bacterium]|nr:asparagine synthase-related protein [Clostridia bacterium]
ELRNEILTTLKKTRMPNEIYSNLFFQNNSMFQNISVVHPFWESSVIEESLRIPTEFKVSENRDKYFFRKLMEDKMGYENCWRKKWAAHHGTGIGFNLMQAIGNGDESFGREEYEKYFRDIHEQIFYKNDFSILK